jgi:two-component system sensor histidine kinase/response regulator
MLTLTPTRLFFVGYLALLGALCAVTATVEHALQPACLILGILCLPAAAYWLYQERESDRSHQKEQEKLKVLRNRFRTISDGFAIGLYLTDLEGRLIQTNQALRAMLGYSSDALLGRKPAEFTLQTDVAVDESLFQDLIAGRRDSYQVEKRFLRQNTQVLWVYLTVSLIRDDAGVAQYVAVVVQDISENKHAGSTLQDVEQLFRLTFDQAAVGIAHTDKDGRFMFVNHRFCDMLGYRREDLFGRELRAVTHPEDVGDSELALKQLLSGNMQEWSGEKRYVRKGGAIIWGRLTMSLMRQPSGEPKYGIIMIEDVTERKQTQEALRESEVLYRTITDTASDAIITMDADSRILFVNPAAGHIFGWSESELVGQPLSLLLPGLSDGTARERVALSLLRGGSPTELTGIQKDGRELFLEVSLTESFRQNQRMVIGVIRDVTERKRAQEEQTALMAREQQARAMSEAAGVIRGVVQASPLPIITLGTDGNVLSWNDAATGTFGWSEDEVCGRPVPFVPDGASSESHEFATRALRGESITNLELCRLTADGRLLDLYMSTAPVRDAHGDITGIMFVYADFTARKRAETELEVQRDFALQVMNTMGQGLAVIDAQGRFEYVNPAYARMLGHRPETLIGASPFDFTAMEDHGVLVEAAADQREGRPSTYETHMQTPDGNELYVLHTNVPRRRDSLIDGSIEVATDLTERKRTEEALAQARDQAVESSRLKSEFLATMSHEIRTPMNGILGMTELLLDSSMDQEQMEYVGVVNESAHALMTIITDILDFSKIEADKLVLDSIDFDPTSVVEGAAELMAARAREKGLSLMTFVEPAIPSLLRGDSGRVRQVLLNLIGNAVKFTDHGDIVVKATLGGMTEDSVKVRFSVTDTGIGLSDVARKRLFQPFVQADGSTTRKYGGTGLGLAICKRLAEMMGGSIGVNSTEGSGSTFWFTATLSPTVEAGEELDVRHELEGVRVLIVDSSRMCRDVLRGLVESAGMYAEEAASGEEALERLRRAAATTPFDVMLTEYSLSDTDGLKMGRHMQQDPTFAHTRSVMLAATDQRGQGEVAVQMGFAAYLSKPAKRVQILDALSTATARSVLRRMNTRRQVDLPALNAAAVAPVTGTTEKHAARTAEENNEESAKRALVLLVEDNPNNQITAMRQLEKLGHSVHIVSNGLQAVKALSYGTHRYDLVFMDCQMPEMDGYAATREIRSTEVTSGRRIPIIAMTANAMSGDRESCIAAGMDDYIAKPISRHVLSEALDRWITAA